MVRTIWLIWVIWKIEDSFDFQFEDVLEDGRMVIVSSKEGEGRTGTFEERCDIGNCDASQARASRHNDDTLTSSHS